MKRVPPAAATALLALLTAGLAACSSGGPSASGGTPAAPAATAARQGGGNSGGTAGNGALASCSSYPGAVSCYFVTVTASGAEAFQGTDTLPNQQACASALAANSASNGGEVQLSVPVFITGPVASFNLFLDKYHGPGTYGTTTSDANLMFIIGGTQYSDAGSSSSVSATAGADGSVSATFSNLTSGADPSKTESGQAHYVCKAA